MKTAPRVGAFRGASGRMDYFLRVPRLAGPGPKHYPTLSGWCDAKDSHPADWQIEAAGPKPQMITAHVDEGAMNLWVLASSVVLAVLIALFVGMIALTINPVRSVFFTTASITAPIALFAIRWLVYGKK